MTRLPTYDIQEWLFNYAHGKIEIDLAESGITPLDFTDIYDGESINLNYTRDSGHDDLRGRLSDHYEVDPDNVVVTNGGQEALYLFYTAVLSQRSEVITFQPGWQQSWAVPRHAGHDVTVLTRRADQAYELPLQDLKETASDQTSAIVVNSPQNPTGQELSDKSIKALSTLAEKHDAYIVIDEEYRRDYANSLLHRLPNAFSVASLSKIHGLPGLRTGWIAGNSEELNEVVNAKRYTTVSNTAVSERLATKALDHHDWFVNRYNEMTQDGKALLEEWAAQEDRLDLINPHGTPYAYCSFIDGTNSKAFAQRLIDDHGVLVMPAEVFGDDKALRITFARDEETLREGLQRISELPPPT